MKKAAVVIGVVFLIIVGVWYIALPSSLITNVMEGALRKDNLSLEVEGLKKGLFYSLKADKIVLRQKGGDKDSGEPLFVCSDFKGGVDVSSLAGLSPKLNFTCTMNDGEITGDMALSGNKNFNVTGKAIRLQKIPFLESYGIRGEGVLSGSFRMSNASGDLKFSVAEARLERAYVNGVSIPLDRFQDIKGTVAFTGDAIDVRSVTFTGDDISAKAGGSIKGRAMDMTLEVTKGTTSISDTIDPLLERYKVSPGYYVIPWKGEVPPNRRG